MMDALINFDEVAVSAATKLDKIVDYVQMPKTGVKKKQLKAYYNGLSGRDKFVGFYKYAGIKFACLRRVPQ